jgi:tRNA(Ile)-lysidine synthase
VRPVLADVACRDVVPLLARAAALARDDRVLLEELAAALDPTDARALSAAPRALARRALRRWLGEAGYPPDAAAIERVLTVAAGDHIACELAGGRRVERRAQRLRVVEPGR